MQKILILIFVLLVGGGFTGCQHKKIKTKAISPLSALKLKSGVKSGSDIRYAKGFSIEIKENYKEIKVYNPWQNDEILRSYALVPRDQDLPSNLPEGATVVRTPVHSIALFTNSHIGALLKLGLEDKLVGMTRARKVYNHDMQIRFEKGEIANLGGAHNKNIDIERILELNPDLIILSAINQVKSGETRLDQLGFKLAYALTWMESTPLGRAEWMKFVAAFFERDVDANAIFDEIEANYLYLKKLTANVKKKKNVLLGWSHKGTWYMPGGQNYMVSYLRDAGADYFLFDDKTRGNLLMSDESVLDKCVHADMWICPGSCKSMNEIEYGGEKFTNFDAFQNGEVYNIYKRKNQYGGSDWWESGCVSPDVVLKDFIKILHPELLPQDSTYYISKLKWEN